jgi:hypothetical protein
LRHRVRAVPCKAKLSIHILPVNADFRGIRGPPCKYSSGTFCLSLSGLADAHRDVLAELIRAGLEDPGKRWPITAS